MSQVWLAFLTGLTTGGISCFAVQGGLLASSLSQQKKGSEKKAVLIFLYAKFVAYLILGLMLGLLGSKLSISPVFQGWMQILAGLFMLATVGKILDLHPIFRYLTITPPKKIFRLLRKKSLDEGLFSAGILGALTVLIPCGVTQSMMLLSIASGSALYGMLILGAFVLGTSPTFFALGLASGEVMKRNSLKFLAASVIFILAVVAINTGQNLRGSVHTLQNYWAAATDKSEEKNANKVLAETIDGKQQAVVIIDAYGYRSDTKLLKAGVPVSLTLKAENALGCQRAFTIPAYNVSKIMPLNGTATIEFTPTKKGRIVYTCSMGMYSGYFDVI